MMDKLKVAGAVAEDAARPTEADGINSQCIHSPAARPPMHPCTTHACCGKAAERQHVTPVCTTCKTRTCDIQP